MNALDTQKTRILIAEDDEGVAELVVTRLELAGYATTHAKDGFQALERLEAMQPAAMVLDINMPGLDGFGVLERLATRKKTPPPTLVLTARHSSEDVQRCVRLGARDFLAKPFDDRALLARVARLVQRSERLKAVTHRPPPGMGPASFTAFGRGRPS